MNKTNLSSEQLANSNPYLALKQLSQITKRLLQATAVESHLDTVQGRKPPQDTLG